MDSVFLIIFVQVYCLPVASENTSDLEALSLKCIEDLDARLLYFDRFGQ